jgi:hypothetical protein
MGSLPDHLHKWYSQNMPKTNKTETAKIARDARTGAFVVAKPAVASKIGRVQIRDAVRKVNKIQAKK